MDNEQAGVLAKLRGTTLADMAERIKSRRDTADEINLVPFTADVRECVPGNKHQCQHANDIGAQLPYLQAWLDEHYGRDRTGELLPEAAVDEDPATDPMGDGMESRFVPFAKLRTDTGAAVTLFSDTDAARSILNMNDASKRSLVKYVRNLHGEEAPSIPWKVVVRLDYKETEPRERSKVARDAGHEPKSEPAKMIDRARRVGRKAKADDAAPQEVAPLVQAREDYQLAEPEVQEQMVEAARKSYESAGQRGGRVKTKTTRFTDGRGVRKLRKDGQAA